MSGDVLVAYGSKFGATAEIAEAIGTGLRSAGLAVDVTRARDVRSLEGYRAVVVGSAVYMGRWRRDARRLLRRRREELATRDVWIFSSGPVGEEGDSPAEEERWTKPKRVRELAAEIGAHDHVVFGGAVVTEGGGFVRRNMSRNVSPELRDRRDWQEIETWAKEIASTLA